MFYVAVAIMVKTFGKRKKLLVSFDLSVSRKRELSEFTMR